MPNAEALKLPDQLLVRYYRQGQIQDIKVVVKNNKTRDIRVTLKSGGTDKWRYLIDLGWIPDAA
jgi:ribosomal protein S8